MDTDLKNVVDAIELAERIKAVREYAKEDREEVWSNMIDLTNSMTPANRRNSAKIYARRDLIVNFLDCLISPIGHQGKDETGNLYYDLQKIVRDY